MSESLHGAPPERQFIEHEHRELLPGIDQIHDAARLAGTIAASDLSFLLLEVLDWVKTVLEPHAAWEDAWLYPEIDRRAGTALATRLMTFEHHQILELARKVEADRAMLLRGLNVDQAIELRGHLFALEAVTRAHLEREERFLVPLLEGVDRPRTTVPVDVTTRPLAELRGRSR